MQRLLALVVTVAGASLLTAADWPQFQGPNRDNKSPEVGLLKKWPKGGPQLMWTFKKAGDGYSSGAVVGERVYTMGARGSSCDLIAVDAKTGKEVWSTSIGPPYDWPRGNIWGRGPRSTPTVVDGMVYAMSGHGELVCADAKTGKVVWRTNMVKNLNGAVNPIAAGPGTNGWGYSWSPLVDGDTVICLPGGAGGLFAALDKKTGKVKWRSNAVKETCTYASPIVAEIDGVRQYVALIQDGLVGVSAANGNQLWRHKKAFPFPDVVITSPVHEKNHLYVAVGFGAGCDLVEVKKNGANFQAKEVYSNKIMKNTLGGVVSLNGFIYGASERRGWTCQDLKTGRVKWLKRGAGAPGDGSVIYADGHLYGYTQDTGEVFLIEASPMGWKEKGKFNLPKTPRARNGIKNWTPPVIANGMLYLRDQENLYCYKIK